MDLAGVQEDAYHHRGQDQQPGELILLHLAHIEGDAQPAQAT